MNLKLIGVFFIILSGSCKYSNSKTEMHSGSNSTVKDSTITISVTHESVCMVNDKFMEAKQIPVKLDGLMYFGCCKNCKSKLENDKALRSALDPYSNKSVNKATAFIAVTGKDGTVSYFENAINYKKFKISLK